MIDQLIIGDKASFDDFMASVAQRKISPPKKKVIKETVPFSNITHDFSAINGETYWEERELEYTFEITANTPEELEELKRKFSAWVMSVMEQKLHDPHIPDFHFIATYDDMELADDEGLDKTTITVTFTAYPYMIANLPKVHEVTLGGGKSESVTFLNESGHPVPLTVANTASVRISIANSVSGTVSGGSGTYSTLKVPVGVATIQVTNLSSATNFVRLSFLEEVF